MIVNNYSILMLFMVALGLVLAAVLAGTALLAAWRIRTSHGQQQASAAERSVHLAWLVAIVCLAIQLVGWPLFYVMLASFVPEIPGAMCIYGVTKVMPVPTALIQASVPAVIFVLGAWLLLEHVHRRSGRPARRAAGMLALTALAGLVAFSDGTELYYVLNMESLNNVSCCSNYGETGDSKLQAPSYYLPWVPPGPTRRAVLATLFFAGIPLLGLWLVRKPAQHTGRRRGVALAENAALLATSVGLGLASLLAFSELLAPWLMRLPFHNCVYCLASNGRVPESPLMLANLGIGVFAAGWAALLGVALQLGLPERVVKSVRRRVCLLAATTCWAAVLMVVVRLLVRGV